MQMQLTIQGVRKFNDAIEGTTYNFTKVVVVIPFASKESASKLGNNVQHVDFGTHENFDKFIGRKFPFVAMAEVELNDKGFEIVDIQFPAVNQPPKS